MALGCTSGTLSYHFKTENNLLLSNNIKVTPSQSIIVTSYVTASENLTPFNVRDSINSNLRHSLKPQPATTPSLKQMMTSLIMTEMVFSNDPGTMVILSSSRCE